MTNHPYSGTPLPMEILVHIFQFVDDTTLIKCVPAVCRKWRYVCRDLLKPMFSLGPEQWGIVSYFEANRTRQQFLNCLVSRFTHAFKRSSQKWLGLICEKDAFEAAKLLLEGTEHDVDSIIHTSRIPNIGVLTDTVLGIALQTNKSKIVDLLLKYGARVENIKDWGILHAACRNGHLDIVRYLVESPNKISKEEVVGLLSTSSCNGHLDIVRYLIEVVKADPNKVDGRKRTLLHFAAENGHLDVVRYLVEVAKLDPNKVDNYEQSCIFRGAFNGQVAVVRYLVEVAWVNPQSSCNTGETPLHIAASRGHLNVVQYLVENANVDFNKTDDYGRTPLTRAKEHRKLDIIYYLGRN